MADGGNGAEIEVVVIGDVYWYTVVVPLPAGISDSGHLQPAYARIDRAGGAWLLQSMIETAIGTKVPVLGYGEKKADGRIGPLQGVNGVEQEKCRRALTDLKLYSKDDKDKDSKVYRVNPKQEFVWVAPGSLQHFSENEETREHVYSLLNANLKHKLNNFQNTRIVVVNETREHDFHNLGFDNSFWEHFLTAGSWLIYHMANPSSQDGKKSNRLWEAIKKKNGGLLNRTLVVLSAASLRSAGFYIDQQAAQETIAEDLVRWLKSSKDFPLDKDFALPAHLIVRFDFDTVFHFCFDSTQNNSKIDIYSRPFHVDPQSNEDLYGKMPGYGRILVASIVQCLAKSFPTPSNQLDLKVIRNGICDGLRRAAAHFRNGFVSKEFGEKYSKPSTHSPSPFENLFKFDLDLDLEFLFKSYTRDDYNNIGNPKEDKPKFPLIAKISIPWANLVAEKKELKSFSRVESLKKSLGETTFDEFLNDVVKKGLDKALKDENYKEHNSKDYKDLISLPFLTLGKLISVDRDEIDGISDLYVLIRKYLQAESWQKPLPFAVFGPPGTGKSFAVREILQAASEASAKSGKVEILEYNLAQFSKPENLARAFHKGQDVCLSGKIPLIFFDEFDSALQSYPYAWLKYFLAPMEDGKFKGAETDDIYTVGKAILIFAGGTANNFGLFETKVGEKIEEKGPDFISRLKAHLNILPINEILKPDEQSTHAKTTTTDPIAQAIDRLTDKIVNCYVATKKNDKPQTFIPPSSRLKLRRAILLRSALEMEPSGCITDDKTARIDEKVIDAFLKIEEYKHGNRSLKAIVQMAGLENGSFRVASLASKEQLDMHVDGTSFLKLAGVKLVAPQECP